MPTRMEQFDAMAVRPEHDEVVLFWRGLTKVAKSSSSEDRGGFEKVFSVKRTREIERCFAQVVEGQCGLKEVGLMSKKTNPRIWRQNGTAGSEDWQG